MFAWRSLRTGLFSHLQKVVDQLAGGKLDGQLAGASEVRFTMLGQLDELASRDRQTCAVCQRARFGNFLDIHIHCNML